MSSRVSVSRAIKPFSESGRPPDWFSQKVCNLKFHMMLFVFSFKHQTFYSLKLSSYFFSTVPLNTLSCWRPQKHQSQYSDTNSFTPNNYKGFESFAILMRWLCFALLVPPCAPDVSAVRREKWWKPSKT